MENGLFRQKSIERISSPESLHDYLRVTSPRLWIILAAIIILLAGFLVYASMATMENTMALKVKVESQNTADARVSCSLPKDQAEEIRTGMKLRLGKEEGTVSRILNAADEDRTDIYFQMEHDPLSLSDGEYDAELVLESTTPISYLWN